jgi:hypothetical protein
MDLDSTAEYVDILEKTGKKFPENLLLVILQLQYLGYGLRSASLLNSMMRELGYVDVTIEPSSRIQTTLFGNHGKAAKRPKSRHATPNPNTSCMINFYRLHKALRR